jgi:hypothetical protein
LGTGGAGCALGGGQNSPAPEGGGGGIISCEDAQRGRIPHKLGFPADSEVHSMAIGEWQEYVSSLEKETLGLDAHVKRLCSEFEAAKISLAKVAGQLDYGRQLVSNAEIKLRELEAVKETNRLKLEELWGATESNDALILATATEGEALQRKLDSQCEVLNAFRGMRGMEETEELDVQVKYVVAEEAWKKASARQGIWKQHKKALECQLKKMKSGFRHPVLHPTPQPFLYCDYESDNE